MPGINPWETNENDLENESLEHHIFENNTSRNSKRLVDIEDNTTTNKEGFNTDTNYVFFFGTAMAGKSVILSSMLYYMSTQVGVLKPQYKSFNTEDAEILLDSFFEGIGQGHLPDRTTRDEVTRLELLLDPNNPSKKVRPVNLTFLETSGENHAEILYGKNYIVSIEDFLKRKLNMSFIVVVAYDEAEEQDRYIDAFFNTLQRHKRELKNQHIIILISKWDKSGSSVPTEEELEEFVSARLRRTWQRIETDGLTLSYYSIGIVKQDERGIDTIERLNLRSASILTDWLYEGIVGYPLDYEGTFWERLFK